VVRIRNIMQCSAMSAILYASHAIGWPFRNAWPSIGQRAGCPPPWWRRLATAARAARATAVLAAVDSAVERYGITADGIADAMARLAFTDLRQIVDWGTSRDSGGKVRQWLQLHDCAAISADAHPAIAEIRRSAGGELSVKLFNKREALMDLARLKGWIADKPVDQRSLVMLKIER